MNTYAIEKIKALRSQTKVSQEDIARYLEVSRLTYINIESGKREIKKDELSKIADFFEKPESYFVPEVQKSISLDDENYKLKQLILYITAQTKDIPSFGKTVLNKLLYFSDFNHYEWSYETITGATYKKLPFGPVPENISEVLASMQEDGIISIQDTSYHWYSQQKIIPQIPADISFLEEIDEKNKSESKFDDHPTALSLVQDVLNKFKHHKATEISEWSHLDKPYKSTKKIGDIIKPGLVFYRSEAFIVNPHNI